MSLGCGKRTIYNMPFYLEKCSKVLFLLGGTTTTTTIGSTTTRLNRHMQEKTFGNQDTSPGICHIGSSIFSFNNLLQRSSAGEFDPGVA